MKIYNIGDKVWWAHCESKETHPTCPDCLGSGKLTVIMGDQSKVSIDCTGCRRGYLGSVGYIIQYEWVNNPIQVEIIRVEKKLSGQYEYKTTDSYLIEEKDLFIDLVNAQERCIELTEERRLDNIKSIKMKYKDTHSWAWNATYHRKCIRDAYKNIEYHTNKLSFADKKSKES